MKKIILSGIKPTGAPHLGNYSGMMRQSLSFSENKNNRCFFFIPDYHALNTIQNPVLLEKLTYEIMASYIAMGLTYKNATLFRQSDIPEIFELASILNNICPKGLMNRAHAYKSSVDKNKQKNMADIDSNINMGLYNYPILMAADILIFNADIIPIGPDQKQHVEIAKTLALKFNNIYGNIFKAQQPYIRKDITTLAGIDGRKMSKSYDNIIPLFCSENELRKRIFKIKTDSKRAGEPKDPDSCLLFDYYREISSPENTQTYKKMLEKGLSYGEAKNILYEALNDFLQEPRKIYEHYINDQALLQKILKEGAKEARYITAKNLKIIKKEIGIFPL